MTLLTRTTLPTILNRNSNASNRWRSLLLLKFCKCRNISTKLLKTREQWLQRGNTTTMQRITLKEAGSHSLWNLGFAVHYGDEQFLYTASYLCLLFFFFYPNQIFLIAMIHLVAGWFGLRIKTLYIRIFWNINGENEQETHFWNGSA